MGCRAQGSPCAEGAAERIPLTLAGCYWGIKATAEPHVPWYHCAGQDLYLGAAAQHMGSSRRGCGTPGPPKSTLVPHGTSTSPTDTHLNPSATRSCSYRMPVGPTPCPHSPLGALHSAWLWGFRSRSQWKTAGSVLWVGFEAVEQGLASCSPILESSSMGMTWKCIKRIC